MVGGKRNEVGTEYIRKKEKHNGWDNDIVMAMSTCDMDQLVPI